MAGGCFQPDGAQCWAFPKAVFGVTEGKRDGGGMGGFFLVYFYFLYIFHVLLSSWGSMGLSLARMVPMGLCHPMGDGPFLHGRMSPAPACPSRLILPFQAGPAPELMGWERGEAGTDQRPRVGVSIASQPQPCPTEGCCCACPCRSASALSPCTPRLDST